MPVLQHLERVHNALLSDLIDIQNKFGIEDLSAGTNDGVVYHPSRHHRTMNSAVLRPHYLTVTSQHTTPNIFPDDPLASVVRTKYSWLPPSDQEDIERIVGVNQTSRNKGYDGKLDGATLSRREVAVPGSLGDPVVTLTREHPRREVPYGVIANYDQDGHMTDLTANWDLSGELGRKLAFDAGLDFGAADPLLTVRFGVTDDEVLPKSPYAGNSRDDVELTQRMIDRLDLKVPENVPADDDCLELIMRLDRKAYRTVLPFEADPISQIDAAWEQMTGERR